MTLGGSFTRGEWYQISWWDPLGGQPVVPILPLSQLPATHWVSTWIKRINLPTQLYYCAFSLTTTCCLDICDATLTLKETYSEQPHADTVGADVSVDVNFDTDLFTVHIGVELPLWPLLSKSRPQMPVLVGLSVALQCFNKYLNLVLMKTLRMFYSE